MSNPFSNKRDAEFYRAVRTTGTVSKTHAFRITLATRSWDRRWGVRANLTADRRLLYGVIWADYQRAHGEVDFRALETALNQQNADAGN